MNVYERFKKGKGEPMFGSIQNHRNSKTKTFLINDWDINYLF